MSEKLNYFKILLPNFIKEKEGCFVAGGAITSVFMNTDINDIDVYCKTRGVFDSICTDAIKAGYDPIFISNKAITFTKGSCDLPIQVMHYRWFNDGQDILRDFDFDACMATYSKEKGFEFGANFLESLAGKFIKININTRYPLITLLRIDKYKDKGFKFRRADVLKLMLKINTLDINSWDELEDQLGGFYGELALDENDKKEAFSMEYALENIDRIFKNTRNSYESADNTKTVVDFINRVRFYHSDIYVEVEGKLFNDLAEEDIESLKEAIIALGCDIPPSDRFLR